MRLFSSSTQAVLVFSFLCVVWAASSWSFDDATLSIQNKKSGVGGARKDKYGIADQLISVVTSLRFCFQACPRKAIVQTCSAWAVRYSEDIAHRKGE